MSLIKDSESIKQDGFEVVDAILAEENEVFLELYQVLAAEKAENIKLKREQERLKQRISEEDARLAYA